MFNTISCSIFTILIIYLLIYVEKNSVDQSSISNVEDKYISLKVPVASGILVWGFSNLILTNSLRNSSEDLEIDLDKF